MINNLKTNKQGITLISLVVAISVMIIISSLLIYNAKTGIKVRNLKMMQNDIELLNDKVEAYYVKYGALPVEIKYNIDSLSDSFKNILNPNDNENYYVLDLKAFEGLTLNYGNDFNNVTSSNVADYTDLYIINEQSHQIYYIRGIEMDGVVYYTNDTAEEVQTYEKKWMKIIEYKKYEVLGLDNMGNLYKLNSSYSGTIRNNKNYITFDELIDELEGVRNSKIIKVSAGEEHTVAIDREGKVYTWGNNYYGQLGNGTDINSNVPICISEQEGNILKGKQIVEVSAGNYHTVAIDNEGKVYSWGNNKYGRLGDGTDDSTNLPICISEQEGNILKGKQIIGISAGEEHTVAIDNEGKVYTWGYNYYGQLGDGTDDSTNLPICISEQEENILKGKRIIEISGGNNHTAAIDNEGKVYTWGYNYYGQLGDGTGDSTNLPICISEQEGNILKGKQIVGISTGYGNTVAIDNEGKVYTWGNNKYGQLGNGTKNNSNVPICISNQEGNILNGKIIVKISGKKGDLYGIYNPHIVAIDDEGKVYTWGYNYSGQLGNGESGEGMNSVIPICISDISGNILKGKQIVEISEGYGYTVVIDNEGKVYVWGENYKYQLGDGTNDATNLPICISDKIENLLEGKNIIKISGENNQHTVVIDNEGKVYTWGENYNGQLGNGANRDSNVPVCISEQERNILNGKKIVEISAGEEHTVAIDNEGKVYAWGNNSNGQLGDGTDTDSNVPICISEQEGNILKGKQIIGISAGGEHTVAIDNEGKVYAWGDNFYGQLGNGTNRDSNVLPICISEQEENILKGKQIVGISAGYGNTVAIDNEGKVYIWGYNERGQLGDGTYDDSDTPICISEQEGNILNGKQIVEISAGGGHTVAIDNEGKVYTWGYNEGGQLGDGTYDATNLPICISEQEGNILKGKNIVEISADSFYTVTIDNNGEVNIFGQYRPPQ